jgi:hypothetical protein
MNETVTTQSSIFVGNLHVVVSVCEGPEFFTVGAMVWRSDTVKSLASVTLSSRDEGTEDVSALKHKALWHAIFSAGHPA